MPPPVIRHRYLKTAQTKAFASGPVLYWMSRDQRVSDNWALLHAQKLALERAVASGAGTEGAYPPLGVVFCLAPSFLGATIRHYGFMLKGLEVVEQKLQDLNIPFYFLVGNVMEELPKFANKVGSSAIITDFNPLKIKNIWLEGIKPKIQCDLIEVDAHNIVPCWEASNKLEFAAKTIRPKINEKLKTYLTDFPELQSMEKLPFPKREKIDWDKMRQIVSAGVDTSIGEVGWCPPGEDAAKEALHHFLKNKLNTYGVDRNNPNRDAQSNLSPYLHFGHLAPQRAAFDSLKYHGEGADAFREELIIRRELADNLCYYNKNYDVFQGLQEWAKKTLMDHAKDKREYLYTQQQFEEGETHDNLWNAAQKELVVRGKMHGFMRMYWAKKILEWAETPEEALRIGIYLNDRYSLDGRDPNGYAGVTWSIGGTHDWGWTERNVFGKIRFMNFEGCKRKFDVESYCKSWLGESATTGVKPKTARKPTKSPTKASSSTPAVGQKRTRSATKK